MELRQLRQFVVLAQTLNFHRAAERLNMAQPPLSVSIRKLEAELGAPLFERSSRGVSLTPTGLATLPFAQQTVFHADQIQSVVRDGAAGLRGGIRIGFVGSATHAVLPALLPAFQARYPSIEVALEEGATLDILEDVERRIVDVGIVRLPLMRSPKLDVAVIEHDELMAVVSAQDPLAGRDVIDLVDLAGRDFIVYPRESNLHQLAATACQESGFLPRARQEARLVQTLLCLVESGLGVGLAPARSAPTASPALRFIRLSAPPRIQLGLATAPDRLAPAARNFRDLAIDLLQTNPA
jgi:DNA-binding transcriptional LysR family regulator